MCGRPRPIFAFPEPYFLGLVTGALIDQLAAPRVARLVTRLLAAVLSGKWRHQLLRVSQHFQPPNRRPCRAEGGGGERPHRVARAVAKFCLELGIGEGFFGRADWVNSLDRGRAAV